MSRPPTLDPYPYRPRDLGRARTHEDVLRMLARAAAHGDASVEVARRVDAAWSELLPTTWEEDRLKLTLSYAAAARHLTLAAIARGLRDRPASNAASEWGYLATCLQRDAQRFLNCSPTIALASPYELVAEHVERDTEPSEWQLQTYTWMCVMLIEQLWAQP